MVCFIVFGLKLDMFNVIQLNNAPSTFLEKIRAYCSYNSGFILNPLPGLRLLARDFFNDDQSLINEYKHPELIMEGLRDSQNPGT